MESEWSFEKAHRDIQRPQANNKNKLLTRIFNTISASISIVPARSGVSGYPVPPSNSKRENMRIVSHQKRFEFGSGVKYRV